MKHFLVALIISFTLAAGNKPEIAKVTIKLTADNTAVLRTSFNSNSVNKLKQDLLKLNANLKSGYPIYLVLYSPGGDAQEGLELFEFIKGLNRPVHTITIFAASMGFQAVQSLGNRYILKYGVLMSHKARGGFDGEFGGGLSQLDSRYGLWLRRIDMLDKATVNRTNGKQTLKSYRAAYQNELWLNGPEAVNQGYADAIATVSCDTTLTNSHTVDNIDVGFFKIEVRFSKCPLLTAPISITASLLTNKGYMTLNDFLIKNGQFGDKCSKPNVETDYYSDTVENKPPELCAYDKDLSIDKIQRTIAKQNKALNRNLRNHVKYSY